MSEVGQQHTRRSLATILAASFLAHALILAWLDSRVGSVRTGKDAPAIDEVVGGATPVTPLTGALADTMSGVALVDEDMFGPLLAARPGPADQAGFEQEHPLPSADIELPGSSVAGRGGGDRHGGLPSFTGRRDRDQLRSQIWNGLARYQVPHLRSAAISTTPESLVRTPQTGFEARASRGRRARAGADAARAGALRADGTGGHIDEADRAWRDADPRLDTGPAALQHKRQVGSTEPGRMRPLVDRGPDAIETQRPGPARDDSSAAAASSERDPMPLELTRASAGGDASGVRGPHAEGGVSSVSPHRGNGTAATARVDLAPGGGRPALRAHREDPYFRRMYQRIDSVVSYPRELALALEQGEVVVSFTLFANGSISDVRVLKSSGFEEFDGELTHAIRVSAPFGPVPLSLRGRSDRVAVTAPYKFSSPLIR